MWASQAVPWVGLKAEPLRLCVLMAACLLASAALYFGALWGTGLKLRSLIHR